MYDLVFTCIHCIPFSQMDNDTCVCWEHQSFPEPAELLPWRTRLEGFSTACATPTSESVAARRPRPAPCNTAVGARGTAKTKSVLSRPKWCLTVSKTQGPSGTVTHSSKSPSVTLTESLSLLSETIVVPSKVLGSDTHNFCVDTRAVLKLCENRLSMCVYQNVTQYIKYCNIQVLFWQFSSVKICFVCSFCLFCVHMFAMWCLKTHSVQFFILFNFKKS